MALCTGATGAEQAWLRALAGRLRTGGPRQAVRLGPAPFVDLLPVQGLEAGILDVLRRYQHDRDHARGFRRGERVDLHDVRLDPGWDSVLQTCQAHDLLLQVCHLDRHLPAVGEAAVLVGAGLRAEVRVDSFCSAADTAASPIHYDYDSTLIVQVAGRKSWRCYDSRVEPAFDASGYRVSPSDVGAIHLDTVLAPGDALWVPAGTLHEAFTTDTTSIHLVFTVVPVLPAAAAACALRGALQRTEFGQPGSSIELATDAHRLARALLRAAESLQPPQLVEAFDHHLLWKLCRHRRLPPPGFEVNDERAAGFRLRRSAAFRLVAGPDSVAIEYPTFIENASSVQGWTFMPATLRLPASLHPLLNTLLVEQGGFQLAQLDEVLPRTSADRLVHALLQTGILVAVQGVPQPGDGAHGIH